VSLDHRTVWVMSCVLLSVNVPVAVNCCVTPSAMLGIAGVTAMDTNVAGVMVTVVEPLIESPGFVFDALFVEPFFVEIVVESAVAVTVVLPIARLVTSPWPLTVAIELLPVLHVAVAVKSCVLPSL
jgi:hypothetical protein